MIRPWLVPSIAGALGVAVVAYGGATMYAASGHDTLPSRIVQSLIREALGETHRTAPRVSAYVALHRAEALEPSRPRARRLAVLPTYSDTARQWAAQGARVDAAGLRTWLGDVVWTTARTRADTVDLVVRRLTRHHGCPWLSTLRATLLRPPGEPYHLARVEASCPALPHK